MLDELLLQLAQRLDLLGGAAAEGTLDRLQVDVVQRCARIVLAECRFQRLEVGQLLERGGGVAEPERLLAVDAGALVPSQVGPPPAQRPSEPVQLVGQARVGHGLLHQPGQLGPLLGRQGAEQPARRRSPPGEQVDQLVEIAGALREHVPVGVHEPVERRLGVLAAGVGVEHGVQVGEHLPDTLEVGGAGIPKGLLHAAELGVQHLPAEQVADLVVGGGRLGRAPLVVGELAHRPGGVARQRVKLRLGQPGGVGGVGEQRGPLLPDGPVEQGAHLLEGAVEPAPLAQGAPAQAGLAQQVAQAPLAGHPLAQQRRQRIAGPVTAEHLLADAVQRAGDVERRLQRVGATLPAAVAVAHRPYTARPGSSSLLSRLARYKPSMANSSAAAASPGVSIPPAPSRSSS